VNGGERDSPERAMVIVAHPDDAEFGASGTVAKWARAGAAITYVICTDGSKGSNDPACDLPTLIAMRHDEQRAAAEILGVQTVEFLDFPDGQLAASDELCRQLVRLIRRDRPEIVITQNPARNQALTLYVSHPDHLAAGEAAMRAIYPYAVTRPSFPELLAEGLEPHQVDEIYISGAPEPDTWIDISETIDLKIAALRAHRSQLGDWDVDTFIRRWARATGRARGYAYAEVFKSVRL
jgi:LmbE family N-acetylglucosaminyl deacetylase